MLIDILTVSQVIQAVGSLGTLGVMIYANRRVGRVAVKVEDAHALAEKIEAHVNGMQEKLLQKTDEAAEARGVEKEVARQVASAAPSIDVSAVTADAAAKLVNVAARAVEVLHSATLAAGKSPDQTTGGGP